METDKKGRKLLDFNSDSKGSEALEQVPQGSGGITIPGDIQETCKYGTEENGQWARWGWIHG